MNTTYKLYDKVKIVPGRIRFGTLRDEMGQSLKHIEPYKEDDILTITHIYSDSYVYANKEGVLPYATYKEGIDSIAAKFEVYTEFYTIHEIQMVEEYAPEEACSVDDLPDCLLKKYLNT